MCAPEIRHRYGHRIALALVACALEVALCRLAGAETGEGQAEVRVRANLRAGPGKHERIRAILPRGERVTVLRLEGEWTQVRRSKQSGPPREGWVSTGLLRMAAMKSDSASRESPTTALSAIPFPDERSIVSEGPLGDSGQQSLSARAGSADVPSPAAQEDEAGVVRRRPQGQPIEPVLPVIDPAQVPPPERYAPREAVPVPDRWRIMQSLGLLPYNRWNPYDPNVLKGDLPVARKQLGADWFLNLAAISDTLIEGRQVPTPVGLQSSLDAGTNAAFGRANQQLLSETGILSFSLIKGDTVFRPPDVEIRFVPAINYSRLATQVDLNPGYSSASDSSFFAVQELFVDKHLRDVSDRYDFDSVRVGIQPFTADFRGFLFDDEPVGVRFFGTRDNNRWQYNLAWLRRFEKDTDSGLNDVTQPVRADDVFVFNLYRQDWPVPGFTTQGVVLYNRSRGGSHGASSDSNGALEPPAAFGTGLSHSYDVTYLGLNGDGHFGRWNLTASGYYAAGKDDIGMPSGQPQTIGALFGAIELSHDFDWIRVRGSALYASGDKNPFDGKAGGFDSVLENPLFAGAGTSYWIRQAIPLGGAAGTLLTRRNSVLPSLRSSREPSQSNFINPGLHLLGLGADVDVRPGLRFIANINYLEFDNVSSLETLRNQKLASSSIGVDVSIGLQYRPMFNQNVVVSASLAQLLPGAGLRALYGSAVDGFQYSAIVNLVVTF